MKGPWKLMPHTEAKHKIYRAYLDAWYPILIKKYGVITYAEGFAGCGIYTGGEPGSPVIALQRLLQRRHQFPDLRRARFLLVEKELRNATLLADQLAKVLKTDGPVWNYDDGVLQVILRTGLCEDTLPGLLDDAKSWGSPILAIFDTFGGGVPVSLLQRIARNRSSEVIYTVLPQHFVRFSSQGRGDEVFANNHWRDVTTMPDFAKREFIAEEFANAVSAAGFHHVLRFNLGTSRGELLNLLFGTRSEAGVAKFKDAMWKADPIAGAGFFDPRDPDQQFLPMEHEPRLEPLERVLLQQLLAAPGQRMTVDELRHFTELSTIFKRSHVTPSLTRLCEHQLIYQPRGPLRLGNTIVTGIDQQDLFVTG